MMTLNIPRHQKFDEQNLILEQQQLKIKKPQIVKSSQNAVKDEQNANNTEENIVGGQKIINDAVSLIYEKIQAGVSIVQQVIQDKQFEIQISNKRSLSSNQPLGRYNINNNQNNQEQILNNNKDQQLINDDYLNNFKNQKNSARIQYYSPDNSTTLINHKPPICQNMNGDSDYSRDNQQKKGSVSQKNSRAPASGAERSLQINEKNMLNEIEALKLEKNFIQSNLEKQQQKFDEQIKFLTEKLQINEKKYTKKKHQAIEMKLQLEADSINFLDIQKQNENEIIEVQESNFEEKEMLLFKFKTEKEFITKKLRDENEFQKIQFDEQKEAFKQKIEINQEEIEAHINEKQIKIQYIDDQNREISQKDNKIKELEKIISELKVQIDDKNLNNQELNILKEKNYHQEKEISQFKMINKQLEIQKSDILLQVQQLNNQIKDLNILLENKDSQILYNDKKNFNIINEQDQNLEQIEKLQQEIQQYHLYKEEQQEQIQDLSNRLRITEQQLIQVKSSWAESEHEREQLYNQIQDYEDNIASLNEKNLLQNSTLKELQSLQTKIK